jgi:hypothetical protein
LSAQIDLILNGKVNFKREAQNKNFNYTFFLEKVAETFRCRLQLAAKKEFN